MDLRTELGLIERVLDNIANNTFDMADRGGTAPFTCYLSPGRLEAEKTSLLWRFPIGLAHIDMLRNPGDYVLREVAGRGRKGGTLLARELRYGGAGTGRRSQHRREHLPWTFFWEQP